MLYNKLNINILDSCILSNFKHLSSLSNNAKTLDKI